MLHSYKLLKNPRIHFKISWVQRDELSQKILLVFSVLRLPEKSRLQRMTSVGVPPIESDFFGVRLPNLNPVNIFSKSSDLGSHLFFAP